MSARPTVDSPTRRLANPLTRSQPESDVPGEVIVHGTFVSDQAGTADLGCLRAKRSVAVHAGGLLRRRHAGPTATRVEL